MNEQRLYRALDQLLPHKQAIERHLKARLGELFALEYDLLLYDVTSTYFEGLAAGGRIGAGATHPLRRAPRQGPGAAARTPRPATAGATPNPIADRQNVVPTRRPKTG